MYISRHVGLLNATKNLGFHGAYILMEENRQEGIKIINELYNMYKCSKSRGDGRKGEKKNKNKVREPQAENFQYLNWHLTCSWHSINIC